MLCNHIGVPYCNAPKFLEEWIFEFMNMSNMNSDVSLINGRTWICRIRQIHQLEFNFVWGAQSIHRLASQFSVLVYIQYLIQIVGDDESHTKIYLTFSFEVHFNLNFLQWVCFHPTRRFAGFPAFIWALCGDVELICIIIMVVTNHWLELQNIIIEFQS